MCEMSGSILYKMADSKKLYVELILLSAVLNFVYVHHAILQEWTRVLKQTRQNHSNVNHWNWVKMKSTASWLSIAKKKTIF